MKEKVKFCDFLHLVNDFYSGGNKLQSVLQAISDGSVDIDNETREFLQENFRAIFINQMPEEPEGEHLDIPNSLTMLKNDDLFMEVVYPLANKRLVLDNILLGNYSLVLSTGMLIWQDQLAEHDLLISNYSKKTKEFRMAADTGKSIVSKEYYLAEDLLHLEVIPGVTGGCIRLSEIGTSDGK